MRWPAARTSCAACSSSAATRTTSRSTRCSSWRRISSRWCVSRRAVSGTSSGAGSFSRPVAVRGEPVRRPSPSNRNRPVSGARPRQPRRLALGVLLAAAALAIAMFPFRSTWWGGWILAVAEAGVIGGLADWFAVTALFRRPLGLPIPHTALIPANWELMAARVGTMVGSRVLTKDYVAQEIARVDIASLIARGATSISSRDLDAATQELARWLAAELSPKMAGDLITRLRDLVLARPLAPVLAGLLELARRNEWDRRVVTAGAAALAEALDRPAFRATAGDLVDDLLARYREGMSLAPRLWIGV